VEAPLSKVFKSDFVDGKRSRGRPKNSWREAVDRDSIALGIGNWQTVVSDRVPGSQLICMTSEVSK